MMQRDERQRNGFEVIWVVLALGALVLLVGIGRSPRRPARTETETQEPKATMQNFHDPLEAAIDLQDLEGSRQRLAKTAENAPRETKHEVRALLSRLLAAEGKFDEAQAELDALKGELDGESRAAAVRFLLERGRAYARAENRRATRAHVEDAWYLGRELSRGDFEFEAALLAAWGGELDEKDLWKRRMREALQNSEEAQALAERRKAQLTTFVATDEYAVMYCLALR